MTVRQTDPASLRCGPWARHIYLSLVLVQPRKNRPCLTERLLMGRKESNQTKQKQRQTDGGDCNMGILTKMIHKRSTALERSVKILRLAYAYHVQPSLLSNNEWGRIYSFQLTGATHKPFLEKKCRRVWLKIVYKSKYRLIFLFLGFVTSSCGQGSSWALTVGRSHFSLQENEGEVTVR